MGRIEKLLNITRQISQLLLSGEKRKSREISDWEAENTKNGRLINKLEQAEYLKTKLEEFNKPNTTQAWKNLELQINKSKKRLRITTVLKRAAILVLPFIGLLAYHLIQRASNVNPTGETYGVSLNDSHQGATLTLSDGKNLQLVDNSIQISDPAGTTISNLAGTLQYKINNPVEKKEDALTYNELKTSHGSTYQLVLSDGTKVWLNARTSIRYPTQFGKQNREIFLTGEAYFEVAHNPNCPFIVHLDQYDIRVLGTSFNISNYHDDHAIETTLVTGSVMISNQGQQIYTPVILKPGEQACLTRDDYLVTTRLVDPLAYTAWKENTFVFNNEEMATIARKLSRWYNIEFEFEENQLETMRFYGKIKKYDNVNDVLDMIKLTNKINYENRGRRVTIKTN